MSGDAEPFTWVDLLDPTAAELRAAWTRPLATDAAALLATPADPDDLPRPRFSTASGNVVGVFLLPVLDADQDHLYHQEIDLVLCSDAVLTVRKTPRTKNGPLEADPPYDIDDVRRWIHAHPDARPAHVAQAIADDVAESFLDLIDALLDLIDTLEDDADSIEVRVVQKRISEFRHDVLRLRRILGPTRDAVRRVVDGRVELENDTLFPREIELAFGDVYDKLLRGSDALESARELIGGVRDYLQAKVGNDQNEVMKRLTVSASLLLLPTFIVGLYGQNFHDIPELKWGFGYLYSWGLIIVTTIAQLWYFRRRRWI